MSSQPQENEATGSVHAIYELRQAAVEHGKALATREDRRTPDSRDQLLASQIALEEKTAAAVDECAESARDAADDARS